MTTAVDKSHWGEVSINNDILNYVSEDGTTSAEVTGDKMIWLKEESYGSHAWYGVDNSEGVFKQGSRFWVKWINNESDAEEWKENYEKLDEKHKSAVDSSKLWIFQVGVTDPDGNAYTQLDKNVKLYIEIGEDWDKDDIVAVFISGETDEIIDVSYLTNMSYPEGDSEFAQLTLKHFSPYAIYDELTEEERKILEDLNDNVEQNPDDSLNIVQTGDQKIYFTAVISLILLIASGASVLVMRKKQNEDQ